MKHCEGRSRSGRASAPVPSDTYLRALDSVDFHIQAVRYRAGLTNSLSADERELMREARETVDDCLNGLDVEAGSWFDRWMKASGPAMAQAIAIELQFRRDMATLAEVGRILAEEG